MQKKNLIIGIVVAMVAGLLGWLYFESSKPLPGSKFENLGRDHVDVGTEVSYNSNPPTSGDHYADWIRAGVYPESKDDKYLIHSLEHGYVIMSYNCDYKVTSNMRYEIRNTIAYHLSLITSAYAHGIDESLSDTTSEEFNSTESAKLSPEFASDACHTLVDQLTEIYDKKGQKRLIIVPNPTIDTRIALTAWTYIDSFNEFDSARIERFIDAHLNKGPEMTME